MLWKRGIFVVMAVHLIAVSPADGQELGGTVYTDKYEISIYETPSTYDQAKEACSNMKSRLVKVDSNDITNAITSMMTSKSWIGASDSDSEGVWKWIDGTIINTGNGFNPWRAGEPNNVGNEDCAVLRLGGKWNDAKCTNTFRFICQKDLPHVFKFHRSADDKVTFSTAVEKCKKANSRLVEIKNMTAVNGFIKAQLEKTNKYYWIGGSDLQTEGEWKWNDNTTVEKYGWSGNEPNGGGGENCLAIYHLGWVDYGCNSKHTYICEKVGANDMRLSSTNFDVRHDSKGITCTADGYPTPSFSWMHNSFEISEDSSNSVYQEENESGAILYIRNATLLDEGVYTCRANNTIGNTQYEAQASSTVRVPSHPSLNVSTHLCNSSLSIFWIPNARATKLQHSIVIRRSHGENGTTSTPATGILRFSTTNLSSWTNYNVSITPCVPTGECKTVYSVSKKVQTAGIPGKITNITTRILSPTSCELIWKTPESVPVHLITGYEINITEVLVQTPSGHEESASSKKLSTGNATSYIFHGKPNRRYSFGIQAKTCAGSGPVVWSSQSCNTPQQAPTIIQKPTLLNRVNNEGRVKVTIQRLDQENGSISCLFVIVKSDAGDTTNARTTYTLDNLREANRSASSINTTDEYISVALVVSRMAESETNVVLGNGSISQCDISSTNPTRRKRRSLNRNSTFVGHNLKLDPKKNYSIFIVSATPSRVGVLLKASEMQSIHQQQENSGNGKVDSFGIILPAVAGSAGFVFLVVGLILMKRRFAAKQMKHRNLSEDNGPTPPPPVERLESTVNYQNVIISAEEVQDNSGTEIPMKNFEEVYQTMLIKDGDIFTNQFGELMKDAMSNMGTTEIASKPEHKKKNRYKNILPFDTTRVAIKNNDSGYINACFIDGFEQRNRFIATQGPLPSTVEDFWLMVVEQRCAVIVMLAKCFEAGKKKCEKYWPDNRETAQFGPITVSNQEEARFCGFVRRTLRVTATIKDETIEMTVSQYQFLTWPDHGVPSTTSQLARMHKEAMQTHLALANDNSVIVHCSAGAGRSGTFIAYDILLNGSRKTKSADIYKCILKMREQRVDMVQNCDQYILVHKLLLESFLFGDTDLTGAEAMQKFGESDYRTEVAAKQFANLSRVEPMKISFKSTPDKLSPYDRMKVVNASSDSRSSQQVIDASFVESYDESSRMIASAGPNAESAESFWKLILDNNVSVVVTLSSVESDSTLCWPSKEKQSLKWQDISVKFEEGQSAENFHKNIITIKGFDRTVSVVHLQIVGDMDESFPKDGRQIIQLVDEMQKILRESKFSLALIHCRNGTGSTGAFCAIVNLIERLKVENRVDVFRAVKDLRDCRMGMVDTLEQYILCHQAVIDYLNLFDVYANFR